MGKPGQRRSTAKTGFYAWPGKKPKPWLGKTLPAHWIIGSDQVPAWQMGEILDKPGTHSNAVSQLIAAAGKQVSFIPALFIRDSS